MPCMPRVFALLCLLCCAGTMPLRAQCPPKPAWQARLQKISAALQETSTLTTEDQHSLDEAWDEISQRLLDIVQSGAIVLHSARHSAMTEFRACAYDFEIGIVKRINIVKA